MTDCMSNAEGGLHYNLVSVHNEEENNFITNMVLEKDFEEHGTTMEETSYLPWIGLHKDPVPSWNVSNWVDGSPVVYKNWAANEPNSEVSVYLF